MFDGKTHQKLKNIMANLFKKPIFKSIMYVRVFPSMDNRLNKFLMMEK